MTLCLNCMVHSAVALFLIAWPFKLRQLFQNSYDFHTKIHALSICSQCNIPARLMMLCCLLYGPQNLAVLKNIMAGGFLLLAEVGLKEAYTSDLTHS
jgi:hypothetical protein